MCVCVCVCVCVLLLADNGHVKMEVEEQTMDSKGKQESGHEVTNGYVVTVIAYYVPNAQVFGGGF